MKKTLLLLFVSAVGCSNRALDVPADPFIVHAAPQEACCVADDDGWHCKNAQCPELEAAEECTTLANASPTYCQVPLTDYCVPVYLKEVGVAKVMFQTVYCF